MVNEIHISLNVVYPVHLVLLFEAGGIARVIENMSVRSVKYI